MAFTFADADRLDELAVRLDRRAEEVLGLGDELVRKAAEALWTSVAADAFREQVVRRRDYCATVSDQLHHAAHEMRSHAQTVRHEVAVLLAIEKSVHDFLSGAGAAVAHVGGAAVSGVAHVAAAVRGCRSAAVSGTAHLGSAVLHFGASAAPKADTTWVPSVLPPSGDEAWRDIQRLGRLAGALQ